MIIGVLAYSPNFLAILQRAPNDPGYIFPDNRFHYKSRNAESFNFFFQDRLTESRTKNDRHIRPNSFDVFCQFHTGHIRHTIVRDEKIKLIRLISESLKRLDTARSGNDVVAKALQHLLGDIYQGCFIINKKNSFSAKGDRIKLFGSLRRLLFNSGKIYQKGGSFSRYAMAVNFAAVTFYDSMDD